MAFGHDLPARATPSPRPGLHTVAVGSMVAGNSHRAAAPGQPGHADPVSSTCDGRRGSAGSSRSLRCLWLPEVPLKTVDLQSGHGSGHEKGALWQRRAPLNTDTRVSASMKHNLDEGLDIWTRVWMTIGWLATVTSLISCSTTVTDEESDKNGRGYGHTEN